MEKENSVFIPVKLRLKIDLVSYPVRAEGLGKYAYLSSNANSLVHELNSGNRPHFLRR